MGELNTEIDSVLHALGPCSLFPVLQCFVYFLTYIWDAYQLFAYVFISQEVTHKCASPSNTSGPLIPELHDDSFNNTAVHFGKCAITVSRNVSGDVTTTEYPCVYGMHYELPKDFSVVSQYDLVCERAPLAELTQTLLSLGSGMGAATLAGLSDRFGRRRSVIICLLLSVPVSLAAGLAPNYALHAAMKFCLGFLMPGIGVTAFTAGIELFPSSHRPLASGLVSGLWWNFCLSSVAPFAYALRFKSWQTLQLATLGWAALGIFMIVFLSEPLRWLVANNKIEEALRVVKKAARWNRMNPQPVLDIFDDLRSRGHTSKLQNGVDKTTDSAESAKNSVKADVLGTHPATNNEANPPLKTDHAWKPSSTEVHAKAEEELGYKHLIIHRRLRTNTLVSFFIWFTHSWIYFALMLMSSTLAGGLYLNFFLNCFVEALSCVVIYLMLRRFERRRTIGVFVTIAGLGLIASSVCLHFEDKLSHLKTVATVFALTGKFGIGGSFNTLFLYTPEIFPTNIRNRALGITLVAATIGSMIAPYSSALADVAIWLPGAIFGACSFIAAFMVRALPESRGRELPQTLSDFDAWYDGVPSYEVTYDKNGLPIQ